MAMVILGLLPLTSFQDWLNTQIRQRNMTPTDFARELDVSPSTILRAAQGKTKPGLELCMKLSRFTHFDVGLILDMAGYNVYRQGDLGVEESRIAQSYKQLPDHLKKVINTLIEAEIE